MIPPIYITGAGVVSAIGIGQAATLEALKTGTTGIAPMRYLDSRHSELPVGEVKHSNSELAALLGASDDIRLTRTALLGRLALREALLQAGLITPENISLSSLLSPLSSSPSPLSHVPFVSATTVGGMDRREAFYAAESHTDRQHALIATHHSGNSTAMIAEPFGPFASLATVSTACSSATNALISAVNILRCGLADIVVAGGAECLTKFHLNGFNTLMILDSEPCRPFDRDRAGLNLGEGAAYLVLETESSLRLRAAKPLARLSGYGNACDAFHQTASSPDGDGAYLAMQQALTTAGLKPEDIDYINAHGTGTPNNDLSESRAIRRLFSPHIPPVSSTKSFTGHTTSASGAIEAVFCLLAMQHQFLPQNLNFRTPMDEGIVPVPPLSSHLSPPSSPLSSLLSPLKPLTHVLSNAFGFGGNDSSIIFSKC